MKLDETLITNRKFTSIRCPKCSAEYLPCEIYIPDVFFGTARDIVRDEKHEIQQFIGASMDTSESYVCDFCSTRFKVVPRLQFISTVDEEANTADVYKVSLFDTPIIMNEEE